MRKCFAEHTTATGGAVVPHLNGSAQQKRDLWVRRYDCLKQRTLRNPFFAPPSTTYRMPTQANRQVYALLRSPSSGHRTVLPVTSHVPSHIRSL